LERVVTDDPIGAEETLPIPRLGGGVGARPYRRASSRAKTVAAPRRRGRTAGIRVVPVDPAEVRPMRRARPAPTMQVDRASDAWPEELATIGLILLAALVAGSVAGIVAFHAFLG
jgi:hypothetical protein